MPNEITRINSAAIQSMTADRRAANLEALLSAKSANTQAQIASTWKLYSAWCEAVAVEVWELDAVQALAFLIAYPARPSTQRARMSHLRTVIGLHADTSGDPNLQFRAGLLQRLKLPTDADSPMYAEPRKRREKRALRSDEVYSELNREWATLQLTTRNRAIIGLLFYAGLRRSEVCKLQWSDVNFDENTIAIRAAKKRAADDVDYVPLMPAARRLLLAWKAFCEGRKVVFCAISKAGKLLSDSSLSGEKIRLVCGIGADDFMPHDARRTLGTRSLENGTPTNYAQKMLRHKSPDMTLEYAKYIETKELSNKVKLGY
jgi:integrase